MSAAKTSLAWQGFRRANLVSTSALPQARSGKQGDVDGGEEARFVGNDVEKPEDMMMEIMDKYVQAGEALAEKENDVRLLTKQVDSFKASKIDLETRVRQLTASNEKLADDEGRWYSLARELENQMEVIKKGETYMLFQDKVDEAEARLEVATQSNAICKQRLDDMYGMVSEDFNVGKNNDGSDEDVDEHRQHTVILAQLQAIKSYTAEMEAGLAASRDASTAADTAREKAEVEKAELRARLEKEMHCLREESAARGAEQVALRNAASKNTAELRQALEDISGLKEACRVAEDTNRATEDARREAVERASSAEASLGDALDDLRLAQEEIEALQKGLVGAGDDLETFREEVQTRRLAQDLAENNLEQSSHRVSELEMLLQEARSRSSEVQGDLDEASKKVVELELVVDRYEGDIAGAAAEADELRAYAAAQEVKLRESYEKTTKLEEMLQATRGQLEEKDAAVAHAQTESERASHTARVAREQAGALQKELEKAITEYTAQVEGMQHELEKAKATASTAQDYAAQVQELRHELEKANAAEYAAQDYASQAQELRQELETAKSAAVSIAQENAKQADFLREELGRANADVSAAQEVAAQVDELRRELEKSKVDASAAQEYAAQAEELRHQLGKATADASDAQHYAARVESLREELERANAAAASTAHDSDAHAEKLRQELEKANNAAASAARENATHIEMLRQDLVRADSATLAAQENVTRSIEARLAAEEIAAGADRARADAEAQLEALRQRMTEKQAEFVEDGLGAGVLHAAEQAREELVQRVSRLLEEIRSLEAQLAERTASARELGVLNEQQREALQGSYDRVGELEKDLGATRTELEERTAALARMGQEAATAKSEAAAAREAAAMVTAKANSLPPPPPTPPTSGNLSIGGIGSNCGAGGAEQCADVLFGSPAPDSNTYNTCNTSNSSNGGGSFCNTGNGASPGVTPGAPATCSNAQAEALQAHAEAMELELRYTLESFEGQLSAMAREKVAVQRQAKELNVQCATLRKRASHYKKAAKESEAQVEQILELQQQLCDAESAAEQLRNANSELASKVDVLQANNVNATMWRQSQDEVVELRALQMKNEAAHVKRAQELAAKTEEVASARARATTLEQRLEGVEAELLSLKQASGSTVERMASSEADVLHLRQEWSSAVEKLGSAESELLHLRQLSTSTAEKLASTDGELVALTQARAFATEQLASAEAELLTLRQTSASSAEQLASAKAELMALKQASASATERLALAEAELVESRQASASTAERLSSAEAELVVLRQASASSAEQLASAKAELVALRQASASTMEQLSSAQAELEASKHASASTAEQLASAEAELVALRQTSAYTAEKLSSAETEVLNLKQASEWTADELTSSINRTNELQGTTARVSELEELAANLESEKYHLRETLAAVTSQADQARAKLVEVEEAMCTMRDEREAMLKTVHQADQGRTISDAQIGDVASSMGAKDHEGAVVEGDGDERRVMRKKHTRDKASQAAVEQPHQGRVRAKSPTKSPTKNRVPSSAGRGAKQGPLKLSAGEVKAMVEKEARVVARELGERPSPALIALNDARRDMDDMATRAQATLGILYAEPPQIQGSSVVPGDVSSVALEGAVSGGVDQRSEEKQVNQPFEIQVSSLVSGDVSSVTLEGAMRGGVDQRSEEKHVNETLEIQGISLVSGDVPSVTLEGANSGVVGERSEEKHVNQTLEIQGTSLASGDVPSVALEGAVSGVVGQCPEEKHVNESPKIQGISLASGDVPSVSLEGAVSGGVDQRSEEKHVNESLRNQGASHVSDVPSVALEGAISRVVDKRSEEKHVNEAQVAIVSPGDNGSVQPAHNGSNMLPKHSRNGMRSTGLLVEDGISKEERAEYLRKQKEERKANRKKGMKASGARTRSSEPSGSIGLRDRRTSAPAMMPPMTDARTSFGVSRAPLSPSLPVTTENEGVQAPLVPTDGDTVASEGMGATPPPPPTSSPSIPLLPPPTTMGGLGGRQDEGASFSPARADAPSALAANAPPPRANTPPPRATTPPPFANTPPPRVNTPPPGANVPPASGIAAEGVRAAPPRMFNPTAVPPPIAHPRAAASAQDQIARHPSVAFSVNETVERALTKAKRDASVAERKATFWKYRCRDVAVWAASFALLSFASDHGFEDC